jgi:GNAT superfamily N-acetyltransferase
MMPMNNAIDVTRVRFRKIAALREAYRGEMNCQIVHDSWHERGFTDTYIFKVNGRVVGYGSVGGSPGEPREILKEFFVLPDWRAMAAPLCRALIVTSGATTIEAQTNDRLLSMMLWDVGTNVTSDTILFADAVTTNLHVPGTTLRRLAKRERSRVFAHTEEPVGDWGLEQDGCVVATGGLFFHYNPPYGDIYMEVAAPHRGKGLGSFLVQELKRIAREGGHIPAARCGTGNVSSRLALQRAGMLPCARVLRARLAA